ncbi:hypothetical protein JCM33374_g5440 [Metschnikowia sp. JCM 33374]|nr:hypothetical protein JCM33374_g5440 [Metschnikowia sp. JCM 33374]
MRRNTSQQIVSSVIYIGSIPFEWNEENLKAVVCGLGNVLDVRLGFDHIGKNKGFAFVEFETPQQAVNAVQLLSKVQIVAPGSGQVRRFRTDLSKEPYRPGSNESKPIIPLNPDRLPMGVQFPPEVVAKHPQLSWASQAKYPAFAGVEGMPNTMSNPTVSHTPPPGNMSNLGVAVPHSGSNSIPEEWLKATHTLPLPNKLPFATSDKINETLSQIPPPQLIELIANLKNISNSADSARAAEVFRISPHLAASATQALLLMGFIDEEVIQEAMKAEVVNSAPPSVLTPPPQPNSYQSGFPPGTQGYGNGPQFTAPYSQSYGHGQPPRKFNNQNNSFNPHQNFTQAQNYNATQNYSQPGSSSQNVSRFGPGLTQNQIPHQSSPSLPPAPPVPSTPARWPNLPPSAQAKLANVPKDQAELIVQVLTLTPEQISALPPDRQNMVAGIKQQYS